MNEDHSLTPESNSDTSELLSIEETIEEAIEEEKQVIEQKQTEKSSDIPGQLRFFAKRTDLPSAEELHSQLESILQVYQSEPADLRPVDSLGLPGGIIHLKELDTVIVPDLHARRDYLLALLSHDSWKIFHELENATLQLVFVGDALHSENGTAGRWKKAYTEYQNQFKKAKAMNQEMIEGLGLVQMIILLKLNFPNQVHFIKGNHENILNEDKNGNYPFGKFAYEGEMVLEWFIHTYGKDLLFRYSDMEKNFPLLCVGSDFLISHAEPAVFFSYEQVLNYRDNDDAIYGLTWTQFEDVDPEAASKMIEHFLGNSENPRYFAGHRSLKTDSLEKENSPLYLFHNPRNWAYIRVSKDTTDVTQKDTNQLLHFIPQE
jgi:hypothetical protein